MSTLILIIGLIIFIGLVVVHEFGHFIVAIRNGVEVEEFAIFFGPTLYKRKTKKGWIFRFNILPLGGYVKLKGEHDSDLEPGSYGAASLWVKTKIMSAGVVANLITGFLLLLILSLIGLPQLIPNQYSVTSNAHYVQKTSKFIEVGSVLKNSPASRAGLKAGDVINKIGVKNNLASINSLASLQNITQHYQGQYVQIDYTRNNHHEVTYTTLNSTKAAMSQYANTHQKIYLGVSIGEYLGGFNVIRYTWAAPLVALGTTKQVYVLTIQGLGKALEGLGGIIAGATTHNVVARKNAQTTASSQLVGPVGIFIILKDGSSAGFGFMLFILAIISLTLALMNILPLPALDGGRLWLTLITRLFRKPLSARNEELVNAFGMLLLFLLLGVVTYLDIKRFL
jgi:regulator of sigma E protease